VELRHDGDFRTLGIFHKQCLQLTGAPSDDALNVHRDSSELEQ
jgi:hypothetical protein